MGTLLLLAHWRHMDQTCHVRRLLVDVSELEQNRQPWRPLRSQTGEYGDLTSQGVIDPAKVVRCALQDASSIAGLLITTEAMVAERPKKEAAHAPMKGRRARRGGRRGLQ